MMSHPPIPIHDLAAHIEDLKANDNMKFSQEYESIEPGIDHFRKLYWCTLVVPNFILPNFGNFFKLVIWHHKLKLRRVKALGQPLAGLGKGMVFWLGKVSLICNLQ